jgi:hypothetical protein
VRFVSSSYLCLLLWPAMVARGGRSGAGSPGSQAR